MSTHTSDASPKTGVRVTTGWQTCTDGLATGIAARYYGLRVHRAERLQRESVNTLWRLTTDRGTYALKRLGREATADWLALQFAATRRAIDGGVPAQETVATVDGSTTASWAGSQWQLRPYSPGRPLAAGSPADIDQAGELLERLHALPTDGLSDTPSPTRDLETWLAPAQDSEKQFASMAQLLTGQVPQDLLDTALRTYRTTHRKAVAELDALGYADFDTVLTHGEIAGSNLLFDEDDGTLHCLLDWDAVQLRPRSYDLARACFFLARRSRSGFGLDIDQAVRLLRRATATHAITAAELAALAPIIELYFVPTPEHLSQMLGSNPDMVPWYVGWSSQGAAGARELLAPVLDALTADMTA